jgi:hypothetical protein
MEASEDDDEYDEDYKDKGRSHDALLRKDWDALSKVRWEQKNYQKSEDGFEIVEISCEANKMSDKNQLQLGWQGG